MALSGYGAQETVGTELVALSTELVALGKGTFRTLSPWWTVY